MINRLIKFKNVINNPILKSGLLTSKPNFSNNFISPIFLNSSNNENFNRINRFYASSNNGGNNNSKQQIKEKKEINNNNNNGGGIVNGNNEIQICKVIYTSRSYSKSIENLPKGFSLQKVFDSSTGNARWLVEQDTGNSVFVFPSFGSIVSWGVGEESLDQVLDWLKAYELKSWPTRHVDRYKFRISTASNQSFDINKKPEEIIYLSKSERDQDLEKFSSSYAFAQSISLFPFEDRVQHLSETAEDISITGQISKFSKLEILRQLGEQLRLKSELNLSDINDTPEYFWENPEGESIYNSIRSHCEINKRIRVMNEKINLITNIYEVINDEQKHNHSIRLERIIIFLIAMEIFITLLGKYDDYKKRIKNEEEQQQLQQQQQ
ncbi:hypothetical protein ACTFIW_012223 [Dictyostelium discoideum]